MRRAALGAALLLAAAACSKPPPPPGKAAYSPRDGAFSLHGPADWRVLEDQGGAHRVTLLGPPPAVETIAVYRYEKGGEISDPRAYAASLAAAGKASELTRRKAGGKDALELTVERASPRMHGAPAQPLEVRTVVIPDSRGFWSLVHTAPAGKASKDLFDAVVESFRAD